MDVTLDDNSNLLLNQLTSVESDLYTTQAKRNINLERKKYFENQLNKDEKEFTEPVKHFGIIMEWKNWHKLVKNLEAKKVKFKISPNIKDHDNVGRVANMFISDPSNNFIEFKSYEDRSKIL